jgi:Ras-related protein Rab-5C
MYYQGSHAAIIVFSLTDPSTLEDAERWAHELKDHFDDAPKLFLVGNKSDLEDQRQLDIEICSDAATALNADYFETSAKTGANVTELFDAIADFLQSHGAAQDLNEELVPLTRAKPGGCGC